MATKCDAWRASTDNSLHASEKAATEHDIDVLADRILANPAKDPAIGLKDHADEAIRLLQAYVKAHPGAGGGKAPSESQKGPAQSYVQETPMGRRLVTPERAAA
ncbi:MAG TPA: hypothetical protein VK181_09785 [Rhizobium sp.]|nr:hypothetical protein [Rhizobium sp.]